jgi:UDP-glucuronate decarboxylase
MVKLMDAQGDDVHLPVNLGNPVEVSILALAERITELTGSTSGIEHRALPADDPVQRCPDIARARGLLGWGPSVALDEGLERTIEYFRKLIKASRLAPLPAELPRLEPSAAVDCKRP